MSQADTLERIMKRSQQNRTESRGASSGAGRGPNPRVICISSGKGGVGKTNIAANLAYSLVKKGKRVLLLDADLNLANIDVLLGLTPRYNLHHVFLGEKTLRDVLVKGPGGIRILPASSGILELASLSEEQKLYFLGEMETLGDEIDILLIDTAAGINTNVIYFNLASQERIIVLSPEPTSLTDAYALIKVLSGKHDIKKFRILINLAKTQQEAVSVFRKLSAVTDRFLDTLSLDFVGHLPYDPNLSKAVRSQKLVVERYPNATISKMFMELSEQIAHEDVASSNDGNIKFFWQGLFTM